jgi:hypothetical protein
VSLLEWLGLTSCSYGTAECNSMCTEPASLNMTSLHILRHKLVHPITASHRTNTVSPSYTLQTSVKVQHTQSLILQKLLLDTGFQQRTFPSVTSFSLLTTVTLRQKEEVEVKVKLRPTVSRPVCLGVRRPSGTSYQFFFLLEIFFRQLRVCYFVAPSLTRGRV